MSDIHGDERFRVLNFMYTICINLFCLLEFGTKRVETLGFS